MIQKLTTFTLEKENNVLKSTSKQAIKILKPLLNNWINNRKKRAIDLDRDLLLEMTTYDRKLVREIALHISTLLSDQITEKQTAADKIYKNIDKIRNI